MGAPNEVRSWSIARASVPLPLAGVMLVQCIGAAWWASGLSNDVQTVIKHQEALELQAYQQKDSARDLALRDERIAGLARRLDVVERGCQKQHATVVATEEGDFLTRLLGLSKQKKR